MSPDIEWRVGEDAEQEIIARISSPRRSRRSLWILIIVIILGAGLGWLYRSIPEPPSRPIVPTFVPTIVPTPVRAVVQPRPALLPPTPKPLDAALQRDAFRLATAGDKGRSRITFNPALSQMPQVYADWYAALQNAYGSWESKATPQALTGIFQTGNLPDGVAWADVGQVRNGDFFRNTRFYRWQNDQWQWVLPDWSFWKGPTATVTTGRADPIGPVTIEHPIEDAPVIGAVFDRFTHVYLNLCQSLQCPHLRDTAFKTPHSEAQHLDAPPPWTPGLTLSITIQPHFMQPIVQEYNDRLEIVLPSPHVVGYYEDARTLGDPYVAMAYATLIQSIVRLASGNYARWENDHHGELFLQAITLWKLARVRTELHPLELFYPPEFLPAASTRLPDGEPISRRERYVNALRNESLLPLEALWNWDHHGQTLDQAPPVAVDEAEAVVIFIEDRYGKEGVVRFLNALGQAQSSKDAIETALSIPYAEFNQKWLAWIAGE